MDLDQIYYGNTLRQWITAFCVTVVLWLIFQVVKFITVKKVGKLAEQTETKLDDLAIALLDRTRFYFLFFIAFYFASKLLHIPERFEIYWHNSIHVAFALQTISWGNSLIEFVLGKDSQVIGKDVTSSASYGVLGFISRIVLWSIVLLITLSNFGVNITAIVTGLGVGGIAVALAAQKILGDIFSSFIIVLDKPFEVGDFIVIGEFKGTVERVGIKTTRFRSITGEQIIMPNGAVIDSKMRNFKRMDERRVSFRLNIEYGTPEATLIQIPKWVEAIVTGQPHTRFVYATFLEYGEFSLIYEIVYVVESPDYNYYLQIHQEVNLAIYHKFEEEKVKIAVPTRRILSNI